MKRQQGMGKDEKTGRKEGKEERKMRIKGEKSVGSTQGELARKKERKAEKVE